MNATEGHQKATRRLPDECYTIAKTKRIHECMNQLHVMRHSNRALSHGQPTSWEGRGLANRTQQGRDASRATKGSPKGGNARWTRRHMTLGHIHPSTSHIFFLWATECNWDCVQQLSIWMRKHRLKFRFRFCNVFE